MMDPIPSVTIEPLVLLSCGPARAEPAGHTLHGCYRVGTRSLCPKSQQPDATVIGTASGSSCPLLSTAPTNRMEKGCCAHGRWHRALL